MISAWAVEAIARLDDEMEQAGSTPLRAFPLPAGWGVRLWLKDESAQPTDSLKHRLARALFRQAIAAGQVVEGATVVELFGQVGECPRWVVVGAGTGATSAAVGRHLRSHDLPGRLAVVDPENSAYFPGWASGAADYSTGMPSRIEGIGRPRMEPGFAPDLVDLVVPVPDAASVAAARQVRQVTGLAVGGATGANVWGALELITRMRARGIRGDVVTVIGDAGPRHLRTCHDDTWAEDRGLDWRPHAARLERLLDGGGLW
ncbi:pyridoxal-phosphate dependent enzyme [Streptosporangium sp. NPDC087985]|uniref:pyridoxal-phosphate dependent enzyme n=1 Tax=Streptosporangium sp. NPDC087985 TaxID=3366196 RepID=UPI0037F34C31